jgi:cyclic-di-GMP-binding biofilm dispersal mediator protein
MSVFSDKNVLIIGGSRGIGAGIVKRFAADGATVAFTYAGSPDAANELAHATGAEAIKSDASQP